MVALLLWSPQSILPLWQACQLSPRRTHRLPLTTIPLPPTTENSPVTPIVEGVPIEAGEFSSSLHCLISEVAALSLRYMEACNKELADTKAELDRVRKLYHKVREESEIINEKQGVLTKRLAIVMIKAEECDNERHITAEEKLKRVTTRHSTELERIIKDCQKQVDSTFLKQDEALTAFRQ